MDYLMFKPFDLLNEKVVIPTNRDLDNKLSCIFASEKSILEINGYILLLV